MTESAEPMGVETDAEAVERLCFELCLCGPDRGATPMSVQIRNQVEAAATLRALLSEREAMRKDAENGRIVVIQAWLTTPNPMLGNTSPLDMMRLGRGHKLAMFIETQIEEGSAPKASP